MLKWLSFLSHIIKYHWSVCKILSASFFISHLFSCPDSMQFTPVSNLSLHSFLQMPPCSPTLLFHHSIIMEEFDSWDWPPQFSSHSLACFLSLSCSALTVIRARITTFSDVVQNLPVQWEHASGVTKAFTFPQCHWLVPAGSSWLVHIKRD